MHTPLKKTFDNPEYLARSRKYDHKCACDICICGKHRCPQKGVKFEGQTTNNFYYKPYQVPPQQREKLKEEPLQTHYDPDLIKTSYKTSYTPHKVHKEKPFLQKSVYQPPQTRFEGESEYKNNYLPNKTKPQRFNTSPSREYVPNPARFEDSTTYKREYSPKKADAPQTFRRTNKYEPSTTPFEGQTSYEVSFKPHKIEPVRPQSSNRNRYTPTNTKFQGNTRYREFFQPYKIEPKERCPTDFLPDRPLRCSPGKQHITFSAEKNQWE